MKKLLSLILALTLLISLWGCVKNPVDTEDTDTSDIIETPPLDNTDPADTDPADPDEPDDTEPTDTTEPAEPLPPNTAVWDYDSALSNYVAEGSMKLVFDFDCDYVSVECLSGEMVGFDDFDGVNYPRGYVLEYPQGSSAYWSPVGGGRLTPTQTYEDTVSFVVYKDGVMMYFGSVKITSEETGGGHWEYTAVLEENGYMTLTPDENGVPHIAPIA